MSKTTRHLTAEFKVAALPAGAGAKADPKLSANQFTAYASVFNVIDAHGDVIAPGAFARTLAEWEAAGDPIPVLWSHNFEDPDYNVGHVINAVEDDHGLLVTAEIDRDGPRGEQVHRLIKTGRVKEMSFAFWARDAEDAIVDGEPARRITDLDLLEISVVPVGANPATEILAVKSAPTPAAPSTPKENTTMPITSPVAALYSHWAGLVEKKSAYDNLVNRGEPGAVEAREKFLKSDDYRETEAKVNAAAGSGDIRSDHVIAKSGGFTANNPHFGGTLPGVETKSALTGGPRALATKAGDLAGKINTKAVGDNGISTAGELRDDVLVSTDVLTDGRPAGSLLELLGAEKVTSPVFSYLHQTARESNARAVDVGETKPTSRYTVERVRAELNVYAHISDAVDSYVLADVGALSGWLADEMGYGLVTAIEAQAVSDMLTQAGVEQAFTTDILTTTRSALTELQVAGLNPAAFVLAPEDWEAVELSTAGGSDEYRFRTAPVNAAERTLWGVPVVVAATMPAGQGSLIADGSVVVFSDEQVKIDWDASGELFDKNQIRMRVETRALPAVKRPAGVVHLATAAASEA